MGKLYPVGIDKRIELHNLQGEKDKVNGGELGKGTVLCIRFKVTFLFPFDLVGTVCTACLRRAALLFFGSLIVK